MLRSPKHNVLLKVLALNNTIFFSKRVLHAGTPRCKWRNYAFPGKFSYVTVWLLGYLAKSYFVIAYEINRKTAQVCLLQMFGNRTVKSKISKLPRAVLSNLRLPFFYIFVPSFFFIYWLLNTQSGYHKIDAYLLNLVSHNF